MSDSVWLQQLNYNWSNSKRENKTENINCDNDDDDDDKKIIVKVDLLNRSNGVEKRRRRTINGKWVNENVKGSIASEHLYKLFLLYTLPIHQQQHNTTITTVAKSYVCKMILMLHCFVRLKSFAVHGVELSDSIFCCEFFFESFVKYHRNVEAPIIMEPSCDNEHKTISLNNMGHTVWPRKENYKILWLLANNKLICLFSFLLFRWFEGYVVKCIKNRISG